MRNLGVIVGLSCFLVLGACGGKSKPSQMPAPEEIATPVEEETPTASADPKEASKQSLTEFFEHCKADRLEEAAPYILYQADDPDRAGQEALSWEFPKDRETATERCSEAKEELAGATIRFGEYTTEAKPEGTYHNWHVSYEKDGEKRSATFKLLELKGKYLLADVEG